MEFIPVVVTVAIVLVILAVFRMMDRNSRSLDKVRRYADKVTENIDKFVEEKTQTLRNAALELDVHQKAEKQLLQRVSDIEEKLNSRAGEVESLFDRVGAYNRAVTDLVEMTHKVDENLQLLKAEESFLDSLSKRIHQSNAKMDGIEKKLPQLLSEFAGKNGEQMNRLWKSATKEAEKVSQQLHAKIEQSRFAVSEFSDYMQQLESKRDSVEQEMIDSGKTRLNTLLEHSLGEFSNYSQEIKDDLVEAKEDCQLTLKDFKDESVQIKDDYRGTLNKAADLLKKHLVASDNAVSSIQISTEGLQEKADFVQEIINKINGYDSEIKMLSRLSLEVNENLGALQKGAGFVSATSKRLKLAQTSIEKIEKKLPQIEENIYATNKVNLETISLEVKTAIDKTASAFMTDFEVIESSVNEFSTKMNDLDEKRDYLIADTGARIEQLLLEITKREEDAKQQLSEQFKSELSHYSGSLNDEIQQKFQRIRDEYEEMEKGVRNLNEMVATSASDALIQIDENSAAAIVSLNQESELISGSALQSLNTIKQRVEKLQDETQKNIGSSSALFIQHRGEVEQLLNQVKSQLNSMEDRREEVENLTIRLNCYDEEMGKLSLLTSEARDGLKWLEGKSRFIDKLEGKIRKSETVLISLENNLPRLESRFAKENQQQMDLAVKRVSADAQNFSDSILNEMQSISIKVDEFSVYIGLLQNRRDQIGQAMLSDLQKKLDGMSSMASNEVVTTVENIVAQLDQSRQNNINDLTTRADEVRKELENSISSLNSTVRKELDKAQASKVSLIDEIRQVSQKQSELLASESASGEQLLDRLGSLNGQLGQRCDEIDSLVSRLNDYDQQMIQLSQLSDEADQSIKDLQKSSRFMQGLSKQIIKSESRLASVEKRIPAIEATFKADNEKQLEVIYDQLNEVGAEKLQLLVVEVDKTAREIESFSGELEGFEQQHRVMAQKSLDQLQTEIKSVMDDAGVRQEESLRLYQIKIDQMGSSFNESTDGITNQFKTFAQQMENQLGETDQEWENRVLAFKRQAHEVESSYQQNIDSVVERARELDDEVFSALRLEIENRSQAMEKEMSSGINSVRCRLDQSNNELINLFGDMRSEISIQKENGQKMILDLKSQVNSSLEQIETEVTQRIETISLSSNQSQSDIEDKLSNFIEESRVMLGGCSDETSQAINSINQQLESTKGLLEGQVHELAEGSKKSYLRVHEQLKQKADFLEIKTAERLQKLEGSIGDFEESVSYRINKLDQVPAGMDELELALKQYMEEGTGKIRDDFDRFSQELDQQREVEKRQAADLFSAFRSSMTDIENSIDKIKSDAYQNVSQKLSLLEDDFFSDLNGRTELMNSKLVDWQKGVAQSMDQIGSEAKRERLRVEQQHHSDLSARLSRVEADAEKEMQQLNGRVVLFQDQVMNKLTQSESDMGELSVQYQRQLDDVEKQSIEAYQQQLDSSQQEFSLKVDLYQKGFEGKASAMNKLFLGSKKELDEMMNYSRSSMDEWQIKMVDKLKENEVSLSSEVAQLRNKTFQQLTTIQNGYVEQRQKLDQEHENYLKQFDEQVAQLSTHIAQLAGEFNQRGELLENQLEMTDVKLKQSLKEARTEMVGLEQALESRMDDALNQFNNETSVIDREIKSFVKQTKLFERADTLKIKLKQEIESMKGEIQHLNHEKKELKATDKKFEKIKQIESDLSAKLNGMISQKRKIEEMDREFKHLLEISMNMDNRIERVHERSDQLQRIEARMRHLDELENEVDQKYGRLDTKREILETTTRGVDVNFQQLSQVEDRLKGMENNFTEFLIQLKKSNERITILANNKHDADQAVQKLATLDKELNEMETKMDSMLKARIWLADTETRLKKLNESSQDQMKILGSIMKNTGKEVKGAPVMDSRELVVRLARQNWTKEEIAKSTGLSKGEVDLILEIAPRKKK